MNATDGPFEFRPENEGAERSSLGEFRDYEPVPKGWSYTEGLNTWHHHGEGRSYRWVWDDEGCIWKCCGCLKRML